MLEIMQVAQLRTDKRAGVGGYIDRFNAPKARPEVAIKRDASILFDRLVRELDLDFETPNEMRTPALQSNRS